MKKKFLLIALALILAISCIFIASCKKDDDDPASSSSTPTENPSSSEPPNPDDPSTPGVSTGAALARYLRVVDFGSGTITIKFNVYSADTNVAFDVRYSEKEITEANFDKATAATHTITGGAEKTLTITGLTPSLTKAYYIAVKSQAGMETVRVGGNSQIKIDYENSLTAVYHGETNKSLFALFDEQTMANAFSIPLTNLGYLFGDPNASENSDEYKYYLTQKEEGKAEMNLSPIINLEYKHYISTVKLYFQEIADDYGTIKVRWSSEPVDFMAADDAWDGYVELTKDDLTTGWNEIDLGSVTRYIQIVFKDGYAPNEVHLFGYQKGEGDPIATTLHKLPTVGEVMGMCGFIGTGGGNTTTTQLACVNVLREYHNMSWTYVESSYPGKTNNGSNMASISGSWDTSYRSYSENLLVIPCVQWNHDDDVARSVDEDGLPVKDDNNKFVRATYWEKFNPEVYFLYADNMYWFAARYGSNNSADILKTLKAHTLTPTTEAGQGTIKWLEFGNEPNGEDSLGYVPYQLAALQSASYDGHQQTLTSTQVDRTGYHFGAVTADPNMKVAMSGLAGIQSRYIVAMVYWLRANRTDGNIAMDAFNFHSYFPYTFYMNGTGVTVGVAPEFYGIVDNMASIIEYRNKYYPDKEIWITEFGWDTNQSYETTTSAHVYNVVDMDGDGDIDEDDKFARAHEIQAEWLVRAYILFASCGVDKATMYMCEDTGNDRTSVGKYGTCGVYHSDGSAKDSYYYLYTLKETLGDYTFTREIATNNEDVWLYEFKNADGKAAYAVWCPTMDGTSVDNFTFNVSGSSANMVSFADNETHGIKESIQVLNGTVKVDVSEKPVIILVD